jgi:two-component system nitrate/nitrite response regulator NarL
MQSTWTPLESPAPGPMPRVLIVSETRLYREGLVEALARSGGVDVCGHCESIETTLAALQELGPDVVLVDAAVKDGRNLVFEIANWPTRIRAVVFALAEASETVIAWAQAGAVGYVPQTTPLRDVVPILIGILEGEQACSPPVASAMMRRLRELTEATARRSNEPYVALTARERQIAGLINAGMSNKEIARQLKVGVATIKSHVHNLLAKLDVQRRGQVVSRLARDADALRSMRL